MGGRAAMSLISKSARVLANHRRTSIPKQSVRKRNIARIYNRTVVRWHQAMLLISRPAGVVANHSTEALAIPENFDFSACIQNKL
jgi:hypothetical protein